MLFQRVKPLALLLSEATPDSPHSLKRTLGLHLAYRDGYRRNYRHGHLRPDRRRRSEIRRTVAHRFLCYRRPGEHVCGAVLFRSKS